MQTLQEPLHEIKQYLNVTTHVNTSHYNKVLISLLNSDLN